MKKQDDNESKPLPYDIKRFQIPNDDPWFHLPMEGPGRDDLRQLYAWTFDDAWKAQEDWSDRYGPNVVGRGPFHRWMGAQRLRSLFDEYRSGSSAALMDALYECALNCLPLPRWCEDGFIEAYRKVRYFQAKSWDDVLGQPHPKGTHLPTKRQEWEKSFAVYMRIREIKKLEPGTAIDGALFERVGREFGIGGKTLTEKMYYREKKRHLLFECPRCKDRERDKGIFIDSGCPHCGARSNENEVRIIPL